MMRQHDDEQQSVTTLLKKPKNQLVKLIDKVNRLHAVNQYLHDILEPNLVKHCKTANIKGHQLILITDTAAWATRLRYITPDLIKILRKKIELKEIETIHCVISPKNFTVESEKPTAQTKPFISDKNIRLLKSVAESIHEETLKKALLKLTKRND